MFKYLLVLFFLIVLAQNALTQRLKIESGISFSSTKKTMYEERANHFQLSIGLDYFDKGFCFLSSNVGYFRKGGKVTLGLAEEYFSSSGVETLYIDCITVNTTFNLKAQLRKSIFYCGIGPRFDINMKDGVDFNNASIHELVEPNIPHINKISIGLKCTTGFYYDLFPFQLGIYCDYLPTLTKTFKNSSTNKMFGNNRTFNIGASLGYKL